MFMGQIGIMQISLKSCFFLLPSLNDSQLILCGDFNCCLNQLLDRSSNKHLLSESAETIKLFMQQYGVADVWRYFNPSARHFSFFSPVHGSFSRIDFFLLDNKLLTSVSSCKYAPIMISDHAPITLDISFPSNFWSRSPWRFNSLLLNDVDFVTFLNERIDLYTSNNVTPDVTAATIWEACKAFLRGEIISYTASKSNTAAHKSQALYDDISELQIKCVESPSAVLTKELLLKKSEFDTMATDVAVQSITRTRYSYYEFGNKPSKVLAHQIRQSTSAQHITEVLISNALSVNPQSINDHFMEFYSSLYRTESTSDESCFEFLKKNLQFP